MTKITAEVDLDPLLSILKQGGSLMTVEMTMENGKVHKVPAHPRWQSPGPFPIQTPEQLHQAVKSGTKSFGFHPEDIGAYVVDLDTKESHSGRDTLRKALGGVIDWIDQHPVYVESPNGLHLYFDRASVPEDLYFTSNGILDAVDLRGGDRNGWLVAPGSVGWAKFDLEWRNYTLEGDLFDLPPMPLALIDCLRAAKDRKTPTLHKAQEIQAQGDGGTLDTLKREVARVMDADLFHRLVEKHVPAAVWVKSSNGYRTGDLSGLTQGNSCLWSPDANLVKDFGPDTPAMKFDYWLTQYRGMSSLEALREVLKEAGVEDPTALHISRRSIVELGKAVQAQEDETYIQTPYPYTDLGNAERFANMWAGRVKYLLEDRDNGWLWYKDGKWTRKADSYIQKAAKDAVRAISLDPATNEEAKKAAFKWARTSEGGGHFSSMINLAKKEPQIYASEDDFDKSPDLFLVGNGVVDLRTGELKPHSPDHHFTRSSPVDFNLSAQAPQFEKFMDQITLGRRDLRDWLQMFFGYCLTGHTSEQVFPVFYGTGGNGKSVLINLINKIMGEFSGTLPAHTLTAKNMTDDKRSELAIAKGTRLQVMSETKEGGLLDTVLVKSATGGDPITCRHLYGSFFTYTPTYKIIMLTNHKPRITSHDDGIWRRVRNIPFDFSAEKAGVVDYSIEEKLTQELPGILLWAVRGAVLWYDNGKKLCKSPTIEEATQEYKEEQNLFGQWIRHGCDLDSTYFERSSVLFEDYNRFLKDSESFLINTIKFGELMKRAGFEKKRRSDGFYFYGIQRKGPDSPQYEEGENPF